MKIRLNIFIILISVILNLYSSTSPNYIIPGSTINNTGGTTISSHYKYLTATGQPFSDTGYNSNNYTFYTGILYAPPLNKKPIANAGTDIVDTLGNPITLDGSASYDPDTSSELTYYWNQISGNPAALSDYYSSMPIFTPAVPDTYIFNLYINDKTDTGLPDTIIVIINETFDTIPENGSIIIASNADYTNDKTVNLTISAQEADYMKISNYSNFSSSDWESYSTIKNSWTLLTGDGEKKVYIKFKNGVSNLESTVYSDTIILNEIAPTTPDYDTPASFIYNSDLGKFTTTQSTVTIIGTADYNNLVYTYLNSTAIGTTSSTINDTFSQSLTLTAGENQIYFISDDLFGLQSSQSDIIKVIYDAVIPDSSSLTPDYNSTLSNTQPTISVIISDAGSGIDVTSIIVLLDNDTLSYSYNSITGKISAVPNGDLTDSMNYYLTIYFSDNATNQSILKSDFTIDSSIQDTTKPVITISSPVSGSVINNTKPQLKALLNDESGIDDNSIILTLDGIAINYTYTSGEVSYTPGSNLSEGQHTVAISTKDNSFNQNLSDTKEWNFTIDITTAEKPVLLLSSQNLNQTTFSVTGTGEAGNTVKVYFNDVLKGSAYIDVDSSYVIPITILDEGDYIVHSTQTDTAGNISEKSNKKSIIIDFTKPLYTGLFPETGTVLSTQKPTIQVQLSDALSGIDPASISVSLDDTMVIFSLDTDNMIIQYSPEIALDTGIFHSLEIIYSDLCGNYGDTIISDFLIDPTAGDLNKPTLYTPVPENNTYINNQTPDISIKVSDESELNDETIILLINNNPVSANFNATTKLIYYTPPSNLTEGKITIQVSIKDNSVNYNLSDTFVWTFNIDVTAPETPIINTIKNYTNKDYINLSGTGETLALLKCRIQNAEYRILEDEVDNQGIWTIQNAELYNETNYINVYQIDNAGNQGSYSDTVIIIKDVEKPYYTGLNPANAAVISSQQPKITVTLLDDLSGIDSSLIEMFVDDIPVIPDFASADGKIRYIPDTELTNVSFHTIKISFTDNAGNAGADILSIFKIDTSVSDVTPPVMEFTSILNDEIITSQYPELKISVIDEVGIDETSIAMTINGSTVTPIYYADSDLIVYTPDTALPAGDYIVAIQVSDTSVNSNQSNLMILEFTVKTSYITSPVNESTIFDTVYFTGNALTNNLESYKLEFLSMYDSSDTWHMIYSGETSVNAGVLGIWSTLTSGFAGVPVDDGWYYIRLTVVDSNGISFFDTITLKVVNNLNFLTVYSPEDNLFTNSQKITISGKTESNSDLEINGKTIIVDDTGNFTYKINLSIGTNTIILAVFDETGDSRYIEKTVYVDLIPPGFTIIKPLDNTTETQPVLTVYGMTEKNVIVEVNDKTVPTLSVNSESNSFSVNVLLEIDTNIIRIKGMDNAGNITVITKTVFYQKPAQDITAPQLYDIYPADNDLIDTSLPTIEIYLIDDLSGIDEDNCLMYIDEDTVSYSYDTTETKLLYTPSKELSDTTHKLTVITRDKDGNVSIPYESYFTVDTLEPDLNVYISFSKVRSRDADFQIATNEKLNQSPMIYMVYYQKDYSLDTIALATQYKNDLSYYTVFTLPLPENFIKLKEVYLIAIDKAGHVTNENITFVRVPVKAFIPTIIADEFANEINIPDSALLEDQFIGIMPEGELDTMIIEKRSAQASKRSLKFIQNGKRFEPSGLSYAYPVGIKISYSDVDNDNIVDGTVYNVNQLSSFYWDTELDDWEYVTTTIENDTNQCCFDINHFSTYRIMADVDEPYMSDVSLESPLDSNNNSMMQPELQGYIIDIGTGIDTNTLSITLNDIQVNTDEYDLTDTYISYSPAGILSSNQYTIKVTISDKVGNIMQYEKKFTVVNNLEFLDDVYVYPNPAPDPETDENVYFHYYLQNAAPIDIFIYTISGELVFEKNINTGLQGAQQGFNGANFEINWDINEIASGVYFYIIKTENGTDNKIFKKGKIAVIK